MGEFLDHTGKFTTLDFEHLAKVKLHLLIIYGKTNFKKRLQYCLRKIRKLTRKNHKKFTGIEEQLEVKLFHI